MNNFDFFADILEHPSLFLGILVFSFFLHYFIFKNIVKSYFDPYILPTFLSVFCFADVLFMYVLREISDYTFLSYILTQLAFIIGIFTFKTIKKKKNVCTTKLVYDNYRNKIAFYYFSVVYLLTQCIIYVTKGVPLFMQSRLETFTDGSGAGLLGRVSEVSSVFSLYAFFLIFKFEKLKISDYKKWVFISLIFISFVLSGSKSNFLTLIFVFWCFVSFSQIKNIDTSIYNIFLKKNITAIIFSSIFLVCFIIYLKGVVQPYDVVIDKMNPLIELGYRFIFSGDIFWYSYPNSVYLTIPKSNGFLALFADIFGFFRIYDWRDLPEVIGLTMKRYHHPSDTISGSNARHNVFGLIYFGFYGSIFFSYVLGLILSFIRNKLPLFLNNTFLGGGLFTYLYIKSAGLDTDPSLTLSYLDNLILVFPFLFLGYLILLTFLIQSK